MNRKRRTRACAVGTRQAPLIYPSQFTSVPQAGAGTLITLPWAHMEPSEHSALAAQLENEVKSLASPDRAAATQRFFPHPIAALGVSNADVGAIASRAKARFAQLAAHDWLALADHFARSHAFHEHMILASAIVAQVARGLDDDAGLLDLVQSWLEDDVSNWAQCDDLCIKPLYLYLKSRPRMLARVHDWGRSGGGAWCRRASCVAQVKLVGRTTGFELAPMFANCERLLSDPDPYVQKGIGWLLKAASQRELESVLAFLRGHRARIDRPTLRYAIEKLPPDMRRTFRQG